MHIAIFLCLNDVLALDDFRALLHISASFRHIRPLILLQVVQLDLPDVSARHIRLPATMQVLIHHLDAVILTCIRHQVLDLEHLIVSLAALA